MNRFVKNSALYSVIFLFISLSAAAEDTGSSLFDSGSKIPVGQFLADDGSFDLEAIRQSGYQGNLDLEGFDVHLDQTTGEPIFSPNSGASAGRDPDDVYWHDLAVPDPGMNDGVFALTIYNGRLIAGGDFTTAGGTAANYIAAWDGSSWSPLGSGVNNVVRALTVYDNELIAGGGFTTAGGAAANYIAAWDGSSWSPLGSGLSFGGVLALTVYDNRLIAGGGFTTAGGTPANYIAAWDGFSWSPLGSGMNDGVFALTVYDNELIAGGGFTTAGGKAAARIAAWTKRYFICGDPNNEGNTNILDITYLITFLYKDGPAPQPYECIGDVNGTDNVNILDITYMITFLYKSGPAPVEDCCNPIWK